MLHFSYGSMSDRKKEKKSLLEKWYGEEKERSSLFSIYYASSICGPSTDDSHFICWIAV